MALEPYFASRDPAIAQSLFNLGASFLSPAARAEQARAQMEAQLAQAKLQNLGADTGRLDAVTLGQVMTNNARRRAFEIGAQAARDSSPTLTQTQAEYAALNGGLSENPQHNAAAFKNLVTLGTAVGNPQLYDRFEGSPLAKVQAENQGRIQLAQATPVTVKDGEQVLFPPGDSRIPNVGNQPVPQMTDNDRTAGGFVMQGNPIGLPPAAVPPPGFGMASQPSLGAAFAQPAAAQATVPPTPVVNGNVVSIPRKPTADLAEEAKRVSLFKSRNDAWNDNAKSFSEWAQASGLSDAKGLNMDPNLARNIVDRMTQISEQSGWTIDASHALAAVIKELQLGVGDAGGLWGFGTHKAATIAGAPLEAKMIPGIIGQLQGGVAPAAAPGAPVVPAATGVDYSKPFEAKTQADIEAWKASAPAGAIIIVNGKQYTK